MAIGRLVYLSDEDYNNIGSTQSIGNATAEDIDDFVRLANG